VQFSGLLASRLVAGVLQAVMVLLLARWAGARDFGVVSAVIGVGIVVSVAADLGMSTYVARARALGQHAAVHAALIVNRRSTATVGLVSVIALSSAAGRGAVPWGVVALGLSLAIEKSVDTMMSVPIADGDTRAATMSVLVRRVVACGGFVACFVAGADPVWAFALWSLVGAVVGQAHARRVTAPLRATPPGALRLALVGSWPFFLSNVTVSARSLDTAVVAVVASAGTAGLYSAASRLTSPFMLVASTVTTVLMPHAARASASRARRMAWLLAGWGLAAYVVVLPVLLVADDVLARVLGPDFASAVPALRWALVGLPWVALSSALGTILQSQGHERFVAVNGLAYSCLTLAAVAVAAVRLGATGAAAAVAITFACKCAVLLVRIRTSVSRDHRTRVAG
jgi:O-antigen/teichoic acid export membrane protein